MYRFISRLLIIVILLSGCQPAEGKINKVGLLVPDTINDQVWGSKGYKGLLKIQSTFNTDVYYREKMNSLEEVERAVRDMKNQGVNLIFGHGSEYAYFFERFHEQYPDIHFVCFNGDIAGENITSLNFKSHAMGFFGGMVAGEMTETNKVGVIAAYEWQPEVNGFFEGALYQNEQAEVDIKYVQSWDDTQYATQILEKMIADGVDVVYPAGDSYNVPIIKKLKAEGLYAIGFVSDQADLGEKTVLTSTLQNIVYLYEKAAEDYHNGVLESGNLYFDFHEGAVSMGTYSPIVPQELISNINEAIDHYKETNKLPNQQK